MSRERDCNAGAPCEVDISQESIYYVVFLCFHCKSVPWHQNQYSWTLYPKAFKVSGHSLSPSMQLSNRCPKVLSGKEWKYSTIHVYCGIFRVLGQQDLVFCSIDGLWVQELAQVWKLDGGL